jgi:putative ABC transport system permease protein
MSVRSAFIGLEALGANPLRTILSTSGVVIGVAALVAVLALGDGVERFTREQFANTTSIQAILVSPKTSVTVDGPRVAMRMTARAGSGSVRPEQRSSPVSWARRAGACARRGSGLPRMSSALLAVVSPGWHVKGESLTIEGQSWTVIGVLNQRLATAFIASSFRPPLQLPRWSLVASARILKAENLEEVELVRQRSSIG